MARKSHVLVFVLVLVLIGWGIQLARSPLSAQEAKKTDANAVHKWEYKVVLPENIEDPRLNQSQFDKLGAQGWELCGLTGNTPSYIVFKRPAM
jgi:hypothetical protein